MQCACAVLYCPRWSVRLYHIFPHYFINGTVCGETKKLLNIKPCVLIFSTTLVWNISNFKKSLATFCHKCDVFIKKKYPLLLSDFNKTWIFSMGFRKTLKTSNFTKAVQWKPSCSLRADGRTDTTQLVIAFRNFATAPIKTDQLVPWRKPIAVQNSFAVCA
jgi:hypothetical protein